MNSEAGEAHTKPVVYICFFRNTLEHRHSFWKYLEVENLGISAYKWADTLHCH